MRNITLFYYGYAQTMSPQHKKSGISLSKMRLRPPSSPNIPSRPQGNSASFGALNTKNNKQWIIYIAAPIILIMRFFLSLEIASFLHSHFFLERLKNSQHTYRRG